MKKSVLPERRDTKFAVLVLMLVLLVAALGVLMFVKYKPEKVTKEEIVGKASGILQQAPPSIPAPLKDKIIIYRGRYSSFFLKYQNNQDRSYKLVVYGMNGDQQLVGDWNGDGLDEIGLYRNYTRTATPTFLHRFFLKTSNDQDAPAYNIEFPIITLTGGDQVPKPGDLAIVGDWDGDGYDTVGFYRPTAAKFYLSNTRMVQGAIPSISETYVLGTPERVPVIGDWDGDGKDTIGVFKWQGAGWSLMYSSNAWNKNDLVAFSFGDGSWDKDYPVVGDWDGDGKDNIGFYRKPYSTFTLSPEIIRVGMPNPPTPPRSYIIVFGAAAAQDLGLAGKWIDCDADDDGYEASVCGGDDCGDSDANVNPGVDADADGFSICNDCNEDNPEINEGADEKCGDEAVNNNCLNGIDEGCTPENCPDGLVRCLDNQPQRCIIIDGVGTYVNEGDACDLSYEDCVAANFKLNGGIVGDIDVARIGCSEPLSFYGQNILLSSFGIFEFPERVVPNDFRAHCVSIVDGYYNFDTASCPNLELRDGESMKVYLYGSDRYIQYPVISLGNQEGYIEKCGYPECQNSTYYPEADALGYVVTQGMPIASAASSQQAQQAGTGNTGGVAGGNAGYDCPDNCKKCCRTCTDALGFVDCIDETCEKTLPKGKFCEGGWEYTWSECTVEIINTDVGRNYAQGRHANKASTPCTYGCDPNTNKCKEKGSVMPKEECEPPTVSLCEGKTDFLGHPIGCCLQGEVFDGDCNSRKQNGNCCGPSEIDPATKKCKKKTCTLKEIKIACENAGCTQGGCDSSNQCNAECKGKKYKCAYGTGGCDPNEFCDCFSREGSEICQCKPCKEDQPPPQSPTKVYAASISYTAQSQDSCEACPASNLCDDGTCCIGGPCILGNTCIGGLTCESEGKVSCPEYPSCCTQGQVCYNEQCCTPNTCPVGQCGTFDNGCGGTIECVCPEGNVCYNGKCCTPTTSCGSQCGSFDDGCGGTVSCGCPEGQECIDGECTSSLCGKACNECPSPDPNSPPYCCCGYDNACDGNGGCGAPEPCNDGEKLCPDGETCCPKSQQCLAGGSCGDCASQLCGRDINSMECCESGTSCWHSIQCLKHDPCLREVYCSSSKKCCYREWPCPVTSGKCATFCGSCVSGQQMTCYGGGSSGCKCVDLSEYNENGCP